MSLHVIPGLAYADIAQHVINAHGPVAFEAPHCHSR